MLCVLHCAVCRNSHTLSFPQPAHIFCVTYGDPLEGGFSYVDCRGCEWRQAKCEETPRGFIKKGNCLT